MFNMDVNQMQLIEMGLNALGFVAGGGILMVLASFFRRKDRSNVPAVENAKPQLIKQQQSKTPAVAKPAFQFIDLSNGNEQSPTQIKHPKDTTQSRRNRAEVYELAQSMLKSSKPTREISDELGMTQAEVSLLKARSEYHMGEQHV